MTVFYDDRQTDVEIREEFYDVLTNVIEISLRSEAFDRPYELSLSFVSEQEIRELNRLYRGKDASTDVLSFPVDDSFDLPVVPLGDIVLNPKRARTQATEIGHSLEEELVYLTIHSVMHLLGYDHLEDEEKKEMRAAEKAALAEVNGIGKEKGVDAI